MNSLQQNSVEYLETSTLRGYDWYREVLNSPKYICAPMVAQSELPFRLLCLEHGTDLCYSPMINSKVYAEMLALGQVSAEGEISFRNKIRRALNRQFQSCNLEAKGKLIVQLCGNNPDLVVKSAAYIKKKYPWVAGFDLNCGCPQGIARKGHYGSYLLEEPNLIGDIVAALVEHVEAPVTCKIRKVNNRGGDKDSLALVDLLTQRGLSAITIHGRTKEERGAAAKKADWDIVKTLKELMVKGEMKNIPVFCNGGIASFSDVERCLEYTGADAVMSSEALLENPQLFSPQEDLLSQEDMMLSYLDKVQFLQDEYEMETCIKEIKAHCFHMLFAALKVFTDLRPRVSEAQDSAEIRAIVLELQERRSSEGMSIPQLGWYWRNR